MICDNCKLDKTDVEEVVDPYVEEIMGEQQLINLCDSCYLLFCEEI